MYHSLVYGIQEKKNMHTTQKVFFHRLGRYREKKKLLNLSKETIKNYKNM